MLLKKQLRLFMDFLTLDSIQTLQEGSSIVSGMFWLQNISVL